MFFALIDQMKKIWTLHLKPYFIWKYEVIFDIGCDVPICVAFKKLWITYILRTRFEIFPSLRN